jgi:cyclophilin family peptidyl-prolyl cis-trans isomerase
MIHRFGILLTVLAVLNFGLIGCDGETEKAPSKPKTVVKEPDTKKALTEKPKEKKVETKKVKLETSKGDIVIELYEKAAPVTVKNFLRYIEAGLYDGTIFHRVISGFMIQGGGFTADMQKKQTYEPIINEANNGLKNDRGTIAMARTNNPNSATNQFFINHNNNIFLNYSRRHNPGYAVFGKVTEGMDVVDAIAAVQTTRKGPHANAPVETVVIKSAKVVSDG